jgi:hypothetical protein
VKEQGHDKAETATLSKTPATAVRAAATGPSEIAPGLALDAGAAADAGDRLTAMADDLSEAVDRLRVAIESQQAATERQTVTTRWLNVIMTALAVMMAVPTVVRFWSTTCSLVVGYWPAVRSWCAWSAGTGT